MESPNPNPRRFSPTMTVSVAAMVLLLGAVFFTISNVQQQQDNRSKASTAGINYVVNPGCEANFSNWTAYQGSGARVAGVAHSGTASCKATYSSGGYYTIDDNPSSVISPKQGEKYTATAWVRTDTAVGKPIQLALRMRGGTTTLITGPTYTLTSNWQQITNSVTIDTTSRTELEVYIVQLNATSGNTFYADDVSLYLGNGVIPTTVPPTAPPTTVPTLAPTATRVPPTATPIQSAPTPTPTKAPTGVPTSVPTIALVTATPIPTSVPTATPTSALPTGTPTPTPTPAPGSTLVSATLLLHGIGKGGDSVNPTGLGTANPLHTQRTVTMDVYDAQNQLIVSKQGTVIFDPTAGNFSGTVNLGTGFTSGVYTIKMKADKYLRGLVNGIQTITSGQTNTLPSLTLIAGDVNGDNQINIVDYNMIVGCYSDLLPPVSCPGDNASMTDLTDDGAVNQFDYNFFIRELTNLGGQ